MSFCRILSTLCRQVVFHIVPHFGKRAGQKVQRKMAAAVQNVKPIYFLSRYFEISETNCFSHQTDQGQETECLEREDLRGRDRRWRDLRGRV
jgi:hypothetical protein